MLNACPDCYDGSRESIAQFSDFTVDLLIFPAPFLAEVI